MDFETRLGETVEMEIEVDWTKKSAKHKLKLFEDTSRICHVMEHTWSPVVETDAVHQDQYFTWDYEEFHANFSTDDNFQKSKEVS